MTPATQTIVLGITLNLTVAAVIAVGRITGDRVWSPDERDWPRWMITGLWCLASGILVGAAFRGYNTYIFPQPTARVGGGLVAIVASIGLMSITRRERGGEESSGRDSALHTGGYYRYTRNPRLICGLGLLIGGVLIVNSFAVLLIAASMGVSIITLPVAKEPWLHQQYGETYATYCREVPRFVGWRTLQRLIDDATR